MDGPQQLGLEDQCLVNLPHLRSICFLQNATKIRKHCKRKRFQVETKVFEKETYSAAQCAAVSTKRSLIKEPPQKKSPPEGLL